MIRCRDASHVFSHITVPGGNTSAGQRVNGAASPGLWTKGMDGRPATAAANGSTSIALSFSSASSKDIASGTLRNEPTPSPYGKDPLVAAG